MSLSCDCEYEPDCESVYYYTPDDYSVLDTFRRKRCQSCFTLINIGDIVSRFNCYRLPKPDSINERIYGEDGQIPIAAQYLCERCSDIYFSLYDLGFCMSIDESMDALLLEYQEIYNHD